MMNEILGPDDAMREACSTMLTDEDQDPVTWERIGVSAEFLRQASL
jgi:hypothetical protein